VLYLDAFDFVVSSTSVMSEDLLGNDIGVAVEFESNLRFIII